MKAIIAAICAVVVAGIVWFAVHKSAAPDAAAAVDSGPVEFAAVDIAQAAPRVMSHTLPLSGSMSPVVQTTLKSNVAGDVEQVTVREGQDVRQGDVIARLDTRNLQAQYDQQAAAVDKARADLSLAGLNREKNKKMLEQHYISQTMYESSESAYDGSVASLKLAEAQARLAKVNLDDAVIRAPFAGTIAKRLVEPGGKVSPDSPIVMLVDLRQMLLQAAVPSAEIPSVSVGQQAHFTVSGFGDRQFTGEVQRINPISEEGSRAISVYIAVANADRALKGGMFAQGNLELAGTTPVLAIEQRAVHDDAGSKYVYTVQDGKIMRMPVTLGAHVEGSPYVEVHGGLQAGARVILANISDAKVGSKAIVRESPVANPS
jgi:membrane fusion protein, multidrug efflux system